MEGKLITPWTAELRSACEKARENADGREIVVDLQNLTVISQEGENLITALMNEGIKFRSRGIFAKQVLRQLARRARAALGNQRSC